MVKTTKYNLTVNANGAGPGTQKEYSVYVDNQLVGTSKVYGSSGVFQIGIPSGLRLVKLVSSSKTLEEMHDFKTYVSITF